MVAGRYFYIFIVYIVVLTFNENSVNEKYEICISFNICYWAQTLKIS